MDIIYDKEYNTWIQSMILRYRQSQVKAMVCVNVEMLRFYWALGKDISDKQFDNKYGSHFYERVSRDLRAELDGVKGLSESNIRYTKRFYELYSSSSNFQQLAENSATENLQQPAEKFNSIFSIPWTHHLYIIDSSFAC